MSAAVPLAPQNLAAPAPPRGRWYAALPVAAANALPLAGVLWWDWQIGDVMMIYWFESVIIGFFHVLAMRQAPDATDPSGYTATVSEFCLQYATYVGPVGIFVFGFFVFTEPEGSGQEVDVLLGAGSGLNAGIAWAVAGLLLGHAAAYWLPGRLTPAAASRPTKADLIYLPFPRVIAMHATIFLGGLLVVVTGWASAFLGTFVVVKTLLDFYFGRPASSTPVGAPQPPTEPLSS